MPRRRPDGSRAATALPSAPALRRETRSCRRENTSTNSGAAAPFSSVPVPSSRRGGSAHRANRGCRHRCSPSGLLLSANEDFFAADLYVKSLERPRRRPRYIAAIQVVHPVVAGAPDFPQVRPVLDGATRGVCTWQTWRGTRREQFRPAVPGAFQSGRSSRVFGFNSETVAARTASPPMSATFGGTKYFNTGYKNDAAEATRPRAQQNDSRTGGVLRSAEWKRMIRRR